ARRNGSKVIYTAHGFHFCKGAPIKNWLIYYPIERWLANDTDCLITINEEDYKRSVQHHFKAKRFEHIHGVGVNTELFKAVDQEQKSVLRKLFGFQQNDFIMFYGAEFNKNKNQKLLIESLSLIKNEVPNAKLLLAGEGVMLDHCRNLAVKLGVEDMVEFLGLRNDIEKLLKLSDTAVASSQREGLPVNIMEAMSCGLPVIATDNRGHRELIHNNKNGWIIKNNNVKEFSNKMKFLAHDYQVRALLGENGRKLILKDYCTNKVLEELSIMYRSYMGEMEGAVWATL
ncbi:MAG: glycosyltransferase, partial [Bacillus sp. (in: Bacteria)]|nr:glycosyltransferase [Bacillus sp. (in: firmicutes)]